MNKKSEQLNTNNEQSWEEMQVERDKLIDVSWFRTKKEATNWAKTNHPNKIIKLERPLYLLQNLVG